MSDGTNLQAFQTAIAVATGMGATYHPSNALASIVSAQAAFTGAHTLIDGMGTTNIALKLSVNGREDTFSGSGKRATRVMAAVAASGADQATLDDLQGFVRKIHGGRAEAIKIDDPSTPVDESKHISVSQRGYSDTVEHWSNIITLLTALGGSYNPHEDELKLTTLQSQLDDMTAANQDVITHTVANDNARIAKNNAIYNADDSLFERLKLIKAYLKSFGTDSPEYKAVSGLEIQKPGK